MDGFLALCNRANAILNVAVCVGNNSPCGNMIPELSRPRNAGDRKRKPQGIYFALIIFLIELFKLLK